MIGVDPLLRNARNMLGAVHWKLIAIRKGLYYRANTLPKPYCTIITAIPLVLWLYPKYFMMFIWRRMSCYGKRCAVSGEADQRYITFNQTKEGIGSQAIKVLTALTLSDMFGLKYAHRQFLQSKVDLVDHIDVDWNAFFGFGSGEIKYDDIIADSSIKLVRLPEILINNNLLLSMSLLRLIIRGVYPENKVMFLTTGLTYVALTDIPIFSDKIYSIVKTKYEKARQAYPVENSFDNNKIKVAVHIRRDEISVMKKKGHWESVWRWTDNEWFVRILKKVNDLFGERNVDIHAYSDARDENEIKDLHSLSNITIHLRKDDSRQPAKAFGSIVASDISVLSKSSFSVLAGIISDSIKIVPSSRASISGNWIRVDAACNFDAGILKKMGPLAARCRK